MSTSEPYTVPLTEKLDPAHTALIVIDYQNDFVASGGAFDQSGADVARIQAIEPALRTLLAAARSAGVMVIFVKNVYTTEDNRYLSRVFLHQARRSRKGLYHEIPVCQPGSWGGDFYGGVRPLPEERVVAKHRFSAFFNTDLSVLLRAKGIQTIVVTGVSTQCCVESTIREGFFNDYFCVVPRECVAAYTAEDQDGALPRIHRLFGEVTSLDEILPIWAGTAQTTGELQAARRRA